MNLVIIGAGGLAREVFDLAHVCYGWNKEFKVRGFLSDGPSHISELGYPPVLSNVQDYYIQDDDVFFCAIGNVHHRKKTVEIILNKGGSFINLIHPLAILSPSVKYGTGIAVKAFSTIASDVEIGDYSYIQGSVILGHDVVIGKYCQLNSFSFLAGNVRLEDLCIVNAGARLIQKVLVEEAGVVGMGSVVINRVRKGSTVFGVPAKRI